MFELKSELWDPDDEAGPLIANDQMPTCGVSSQHGEGDGVEVSLDLAIDAAPRCGREHREKTELVFKFPLKAWRFFFML